MMAGEAWWVSWSLEREWEDYRFSIGGARDAF